MMDANMINRAAKEILTVIAGDPLSSEDRAKITELAEQIARETDKPRNTGAAFMV